MIDNEKIDEKNLCEDKYDKYDLICNLCYMDLFIISAKNNHILNFKNLNTNDESHLFVFEIAKLVAANTQSKIRLNFNIFKRFKMYWPIRKAFYWFKKYDKNITDIDVEKFLERLEKFAYEHTGDSDCFSKIYQAYYKK